jgi:cell division septation protein DedD
LVTNLATFGYATWRCRQEAQGQQRLMATAEQRAQAQETEMAALRQRLDRLQVWGELIELQQDVNAAHASINRLNFGDALAIVDRVQRRLDGGEYGTLFRERRAELVPHLDLARQALRSADSSAHGHLVELDQRAFQILAGVSSPGDFPGALPAPTPAVSPTPPPPIPGATMTPSATPSPSPTPSPTPRPAASTGGP